MKRSFFFAAAVMLAAFTATPAFAGKLNFCGGPDGGNYNRAAVEIKNQAAGAGGVDLTVYGTAGSWENLQRLSKGECDAALVQNDALRVFRAKNPTAAFNIERAGTLYVEHVHFLCNSAVAKDGLKRIPDLKKDKHVIAIGPAGSGSSVTWDSFILADQKLYGDIRTVPLAGLRALEKVKDGSEVSCMLFTSALNSSFVSNDMNAKENNGKVALIPANDGDFDNAKDEKGKPLYSYTQIPGGTYKNIQTGVFSSAVKTVGVDAVIVFNAAWIDANSKDYDAFLRAKRKAEPTIRSWVGQ